MKDVSKIKLIIIELSNKKKLELSNN